MKIARNLLTESTRASSSLLRGVAKGTTMLTHAPINCNSTGKLNMEARSDTSLFHAVAQKRDDDAFSELFERYRTRAFNLALRILREPALAQDAVQEAMLAVWRSAQSIQPENVENWVM